ncbi:MAG: DUF3102 domain-containing protein [Aquamicrobium sp.]|uniref:hypothetical protein n=1 Tax=Aquamicrobium sp. TaxID=1872579 RepID=UPI00349EBEE2|nr:DUF3102 domain-containing protein [Aquamicrobium sp.]
MGSRLPARRQLGDRGGFDYSRVPAAHRKPMKADAIEIRKGLIGAAAALMEAGERLSRWKEITPHGAWLDWVWEEAGMSDQSARDAINVFRRFEHSPTLLHDLDLALPPTALVRLATAPDGAFEDVLDRVKDGERLRVIDVQHIVADFRKRNAEEEAGVKTIPAAEPVHTTAAAALLGMADLARDELVPQIVTRLRTVLHVIEDAEALHASKGKTSLARLQQNLRGDAQWLTDALEQLSQKQASTGSMVVHKTLLARAGHEPGAWADVTAFLRDISHSVSWESIKAAQVPDLLKRGRTALHAVLSPQERISAIRMLGV